MFPQRTHFLVVAALVAACTPGLAPAQARSPDSVDTLTVRSSVLGEDRRLYVSLPESWGATERAYPVLLVLDGEYLASTIAPVARTLAELGHAPESIVVGVANLEGGGMRSRIRDLTPPGMSVSGSTRDQGGDRFLEFLETEVLPEIDARYRGGHPRMILGHSSGGLLATWAAATRPAAFPVAVSVDGPASLDDDRVADLLLGTAASPESPPVRYASVEAVYGWTESAWSELTATAPETWTLVRHALDGETHQTAVFLGAYLGLKGVFADYSVAADASGAPVLDRFERYRRFDDAFPTPIPPPPSVLRLLAEDLLTVGEWDAAVRARDWMVDAYGDVPDLERIDALFERVEPLLPLEVTVQDLLDAPWPSARAAAPYLGEWRGSYRSGAGTPREMAVRLRVVEGRVEGELVQWPGNGAELVQRLEYLKILPDGFEYGRMNGMRPRGMLVGSGRVQDGVWVGEEELRGVLFPLPGGPSPPTIPTVRIRLERR